MKAVLLACIVRAGVGVVLKGEPNEPGKRCLRFLNIPNNQGREIEEQSALWNLRAHPFWDKANPTTFRTWGPRAAMPCSAFSDREDGHNNMDCLIPNASTPAACSKEHMPPSVDPSLAAYYSECDTFCVVRSPSERLIDFYFDEAGDEICRERDFQEWLDHKEKEMATMPYVGDCHMLSLSTYVYGTNEQPISESQNRYCTHLIQHSNHERTFSHRLDDLMKDYGLTLRFEFSPNPQGCPNLLEPAKRFAEKYYAMDLANFGFDQ